MWHHRAVNGMWEIEGPVEVDSLCPAGFSRIETEVSLPNGLAGWGANVLASAVTFGASLPFQLYSPSTVRVDCVYSGGR